MQNATSVSLRILRLHAYNAIQMGKKGSLWAEHEGNRENSAKEESVQEENCWSSVEKTHHRAKNRRPTAKAMGDMRMTPSLEHALLLAGASSTNWPPRHPNTFHLE
jgi:hypothetical protein